MNFQIDPIHVECIREAIALLERAQEGMQERRVTWEHITMVSRALGKLDALLPWSEQEG